jgi:hypothetical protein
MDNVRLGVEETGKDDLKYEKWPNVCTMVVNKGSGLAMPRLVAYTKYIYRRHSYYNP